MLCPVNRDFLEIAALWFGLVIVLYGVSAFLLWVIVVQSFTLGNGDEDVSSDLSS
jgi:hypothetical protein